MSYVLLFAAAFVAFSISAVCGGGAGLLLIPVLGVFMTVSHVPAALTIGTATSSLSRLLVFSKDVQWGMTTRFVPASLVGAVIGAELLAYMEPMYVELCMGLFLVSNLPDLLRRQIKSDLQTNPMSGLVILAIGTMAGIISALTGAVGVLFNRFYMRCGLGPQEIVATRAANEILLHVFKLFLYTQLKLFSQKAVVIGLVVALAAALSSRCMRLILPKISTEIFVRIGLSTMIIIGVMMLNSAVIHIRMAADPNIRINHLAEDTEATVTWKKLVYAFEFNYGEGPEIEKVIPLSSLSIAQQEHVSSLVDNYDCVIVEKVYSFTGTYYEANFFGPDGQPIKKVDFN